MIYEYSCNSCLQRYIKSNEITQRTKSGSCPYCKSEDTKLRESK